MAAYIVMIDCMNEQPDTCNNPKLYPERAPFERLMSYDSHVKRVSQRSAESGGFSPGNPVSSYREC